MIARGQTSMAKSASADFTVQRFGHGSVHATVAGGIATDGAGDCRAGRFGNATALAPALPQPEAQMRQAATAVVVEAITRRGYRAATYAVIAELAGLAPADVRRAFPSKEELILETLGLPEAVGSVPGLVRLSGEELVARYLAFWETADNAVVLRGVFCAALADERVAIKLERFLTRTLVRPLADALQATDACPRIRLLISYLIGLTLSRYLLAEEPLASADRETVAAWAGPSIDAFLHRRLGAP